MGQIALTLPQSNLPNATEDPKIVSDFTLIQNVINGNIDPSNLSPTGGIMRLVARNTATNTAAAAGELIVTTAVPVTVTLPAPVANGLVGVISCGFASGASPTTVAGTNIFGVGANGVTSFKLGTPFATVLMQSDGTNWFIVSGQQDTGWVALTLNGAASITAAAGQLTPSARLRGDMVNLKGVMRSGASSGGFVTWATVPVAARPSVNLSLLTFANDAGAYQITVQSGGSLIGSSTVVPTMLYLDGLQYALA